VHRPVFLEHNILEIGTVSEKLCSVEYWMMDKVQKSSNPECIHHRQNTLERWFTQNCYKGNFFLLTGVNVDAAFITSDFHCVGAAHVEEQPEEKRASSLIFNLPTFYYIYTFLWVV
jgi:hypothetical protein